MPIICSALAVPTQEKYLVTTNAGTSVSRSSEHMLYYWCTGFGDKVVKMPRKDYGKIPPRYPPPPKGYVKFNFKKPAISTKPTQSVYLKEQQSKCRAVDTLNRQNKQHKMNDGLTERQPQTPTQKKQEK